MKKLVSLSLILLLAILAVLPAVAYNDFEVIGDTEENAISFRGEFPDTYPTAEPFNAGCGAFWLETHTWRNGMEYYGETRYNRVILSEGITKIPAGAFYGCEIETLVLPASLTYIDEYAFLYANVGEIQYNGTVESWLKVTQYARIPGNHTVSFNGEVITDVVIPDGTAEIGRYAFAGFHSIRSVAIPDSVNYIYRSAFDRSVDENEAGSGFDPDYVEVCPECGRSDCPGAEGWDCAYRVCPECYSSDCPGAYGGPCWNSGYGGYCYDCGSPDCPGAYGEPCWNSGYGDYCYDCGYRIEECRCTLIDPGDPDDWSLEIKVVEPAMSTFAIGDAAKFFILCNEDSYAASFAANNGYTAHYYQHKVEKVRNGDIITVFCKECDYSYDYIADENSHEYVAYPGKDPTCTKGGYAALYVCSICKAEKFEGLIPALGHNIVTVNGSAPTCTRSGYNTYEKCTRCAYSTYNDNYLYALGHRFSVVETKKATCAETGYSKSVCQRSGCSATKTTTLSKTKHNCGRDDVCDYCGAVVESHTHAYTNVSVHAPTCRGIGYTSYTCACGAGYDADFVPALGHNFGEGTVTVEKTCTQDGKLSYTCKRCGALDYTILRASHNWVEPSCTMTGDLYRYCADCFAIDDEAYTVQHSWLTTAVEVAATCTKDGYVRGTCTACGLDGTQVIEAFGHDFYNGRCKTCASSFADTIRTASELDAYGMSFTFDETVSSYGANPVNKYGTYLDYNEDAFISKVGIYLTQVGTEWKRCIAFTGTGLTYANYVPYLANGDEIIYSGLNSDLLNTYPLVKNAQGVWNYANYALIEVDLTDAYGDSILSARSIGAAGAKTRIFYDLDAMIEWLEEDACKHNWNTPVVTVSPTCTEFGEKLYVCDTCDTKETEIVLPSHEYIEHEGKAPTCTESGYAAYTTCTHCDATTYTEIPAIGHTYVLNAHAPTCTKDGYNQYTCSTCGDSYTEAGAPATGHDYKNVTVIAPTCTQKGYTKHACACGDYYKTDEVAAIGHNYGSNTYVPTCTEDGYTKYTCSTCGDSYTEVGEAAIGHNMQLTVAGTDATCQKTGVTAVYTCANGCGETSGGETIPVTSHSYNWMIYDPTCTEEGYTRYTCYYCGDTFVSNSVAALGHNYKAVVTEPTCTEGGYTIHTCTRCDDFFVTDEAEALGHNYDVSVVPPTCTEEGYTKHTCTVCGVTNVSDKVAVVEHSYESVVTPPTATAPGYTTHTCKVCGYAYVSDETEAHAHKYFSQLKDPTCEEDGYVKIVCACGDVLFFEVRPALTHDYTSKFTKANRKADAYYTHTCNRCNHSYKEVIPTQDVYVGEYLNSLELAAEYVLWYWAPVVPGTIGADRWMEFTSYDANGVATRTIAEEDTSKSDAEYYGFMGPAVPAKNMNDKIEGVMYYVYDGLRYRLTHSNGGMFESNVATYCVRQIDKFATAASGTNNYKVRQILIALLNYGSAAQVEFDYNTTAVSGDPYKGLVNLRMDANLRKTSLNDFANITTSAARKETNTSKATKFDFYSNSAELKQRIVTKFYFTLKGGVTQSLLKNYEFRGTMTTTKGTSKYVIDGTEFVYDSKYKDVCISLADPAAADLGTSIVGAIYEKKSGTQVSDTVTACFEAYAAKQLDSTSVSDTNKALLKSVIAYSRAAYSRYR